MTTNKTLKIADFKIANELPFILIAGPCVIETHDHAIMMASEINKIANKLKIPFIFKTSYDKANRSSVKSKRGVSLSYATEVFRDIKKIVGCPILTDFHEPAQAKHQLMEFVDIIQTPAFLCRQTDLLKAAADTGKIINIKKGQFLAPWDVVNIIEKMKSFGNDNIMLCERGVCFGYNSLVTDMTGLKVMADTGYPVIMDATHAIQKPSGQGYCSGGDRELASVIARAAIAVGVAGVFIETHQNPDKAPCDGANMIRLDCLERLLVRLKALDEISKSP